MTDRRIALLVCGRTVPELRPRRGDFPDWFRAGLGLPPERVLVVDLPAGAAPPDPAGLAGAVVTGSPAMATDGAPWSLAAERWLAAAVPAGLPVLGVCYGHQLLARALGGAVGDNPRGREVGTVELELLAAAADDLLFSGLPSPLRAQESHSQSVLAPPPGARVLARNVHDACQAFAVGERAWGVQFHPEFDANVVRGYLTSRRAEIVAEGLDPDALRAAVRESPEAASLLPRFAALCAEQGCQAPCVGRVPPRSGGTRPTNGA